MSFGMYTAREEDYCAGFDSKLANSGVRAHDFLKKLLMTSHFDDHITTALKQEML